MTAQKVVVIDYGMGNILSVARAFEHEGAEVQVSGNVDDVLNAKKIILPGVGAFRDAIVLIRERQLDKALREAVERGTPLLGICLGMQLLLEESEEFGTHQGLGFIPGKVLKIPNHDEKGLVNKIPHIGWNALQRPEHAIWENTILEDVPEASYVYFVHSYRACPDDEKVRLADCYYESHRIAAVLKYKNIFGCQFHPEKSGAVGLKIVRNFLHVE